MWGHLPGCGCGLCSCFPRVFALIALGNRLPGFVPWISDRLRLVEADLRDELERRGAPPALTQASTPVLPPPPGREVEGEATTPPPKAEKLGAQDQLRTTAKGRPATPPRDHRAKEEEPPEVKREEPPHREGDHPGRAEEEAPPALASSHRGPSHSHRERRPRRSEGRKSKRRSRSRRDHSRHRRRREDSRDRGERRSPRAYVDRKERKSRAGWVPEPEGPPPGRLRGGEKPPEPPYPPPGRGWVGPVPRSSHPRWNSGTNKGIVKRAKQERFNSRRRRR